MSRSIRRPDCVLRPSADIAGRSVALSIDVPAVFDTPLAPHHKLIGGWAAARDPSARRYTRPEARRYIEQAFDAAVLDILKPLEIADLRVAVLIGSDMLPPAIALICDSIGQMDLRWIEKSNVLRDTLFTTVAPVSWRATAYKALEETLPGILPVFGFDELFEELSGYYWDGETDDAAARNALITYHGHGDEDVDEMTLPSQVKARRPEWMLASNAKALKHLPTGLRQRLRTLRDAHKAIKDASRDSSAWLFDWDLIREYLPDMEDCAHLPPMTLVPFDEFARELDDVGRMGMECGFMDLAGLCQLPDAGMIDDWFISLKLGVDFLLAAQALIDVDPTQH